MSDISFTEYSKDKLLIKGNMVYDNSLKHIGAKYNSKLPDGPGWLLPVENKKLLLSFIKLQKDKEKELQDIQTHVKSRKTQNRFHRENSQTNMSISGSDTSDNDLDELKPKKQPIKSKSKPTSKSVKQQPRFNRSKSSDEESVDSDVSSDSN